ncbi:MAG: alginate export family protein [Planctomycetes bacterium]|nr:alginate export family protein [Planctomycetota bacterium]
MLLTTASRRPIWLGTVALSLLSAAPLLAQDPPKAEKRPFRINDLLHTPDYLKVSGEYRLRYEGLNNQFRNSTTRNNEDQIASRALLRVDYRRGAWGASVEGIDGRMWNAKGNSFADNTTVDTGDLLQAFVSYRTDNGHELTAGRWTMDLGSRRLIARNQYRNTINSFNGVRWDYENKDSGYKAGAFWAMPTERKPTSRAALVDNKHDVDTQTSDFQFWGVHATKQLDPGSTAQVYLLGYDDTRGSTDQQLYSVGFRYFRPAKPGKVFGETEAVYQFGKRGAQDVSAYFVHGSAGYTFDAPTEPAFRVAIDVATGNDSGSDYTRFNTLFGARRFEYGPTGIYGAIGRRNLLSPEIRYMMKPCDSTWVMIAWRDFYLQNSNDSWVEASDNTGAGRHVGSQTEVRLRWDPAKKSVRFETGMAYLAGGNYRDTSTTGRNSDTSYFFFETIFTL